MENTINLLKKIFAEALICAENELSLETPYVEMGVDSILAIQITDLIGKFFQIKLTPSDLFNQITILDLAKFLENLRRDAMKKESLSTGITSETKNNFAIIGMGGYFPKAQDVQTYWEYLLHGEDLVSNDTRWGGKWKGGFLTNLKGFDADFFNISPKEAKKMDPQQRLFLEVAWHAFEDAGYTKEQLNQSSCGVFVGTLPGDYKYLLEEEKYSTHSFTGNAVSAIAARVSYFLNLKGPSLAVDAACSSALTALLIAIDAIKSGHCKNALVGATSLFATEELFEFALSSNLISKSGKCLVFDQCADGFVPAECVTAVMIKPTADAIKDGDTIYAQIHCGTMNHDGKTNGLMSPNSFSQRDLIRKLYTESAVLPQDIGYIECHGTGTVVGDPIEIQGLNEVFQSFPGKSSPYLGSCKANMGHCLTASGLASLIKGSLILNQSTIPPQIGLNVRNENIDFGPFKISQKIIPFPKDKKYVGVSAFGFTGTNAHILLEKAPENKIPSFKEEIPLPFFYSAKNTSALEEMIRAHIKFIDHLEARDLPSYSSTLLQYRTHFSEASWGVIASSKEELLGKLLNRDLSSSCQCEDLLKEYGQSLEDLNNGLFKETIKLHLPPYPFQRKDFWIEEERSENLASKAPEKKAQLKNYFIEKISTLLDYKKSEIDSRRPLTDYGVDSLIVMELLTPLKKKFPDLDPKLIFMHRTIDTIVEYLEEKNHDTFSQSFDLSRETIILKQKNSLEYCVAGTKGELVLFLPPLNTAYEGWIQQIRYFSRLSYRLLIPHYPGHRGSEMSQELSLPHLAEKILDIAKSEAKGQTTFHVVGWSLGGCIALLMSLGHSKLTESLTLVNTAASFPEELFTETIALRKELDSYQHLLSDIFLSDEKAQNIDHIQAHCPLDKLKYYYDALEILDLGDQIENINQPTLIIHGEHDPVIGKAQVDQLLKIPLSRIETIKDGGHFVPLLRGRIFNLILEKFLSSAPLIQSR